MPEMVNVISKGPFLLGEVPCRNLSTLTRKGHRSLCAVWEIVPYFFHLGGSFGHDTVGLSQVFNPVVTITKINNCPHVFECL